MSENLETFNKMSQMYAEGNVPWDAELPPPEVVAMVEKMPAGRALDLGCSYGRASIYMAQQGWQVDGIDFIPLAIATAKERAKKVGVAVNFQVGDITQLPFSEPYDFVLDVGCGHGLMPAQWRDYHHELKRLLKPNGIFLLFARFLNEADPQQPGVAESHLHTLFNDGFHLDNLEKGVTKMSNGDNWESAWLWWRRM